MTPDTLNIVNTYLRATDAEVSHGMRWYTDAHNDVISTGADPWVGAGIFAAYSINTPWYRNWDMAMSTLRANEPRTDTLGISVQFACDILLGAHPLDVYAKSAPKLAAFTAAIADPFNSTIAVIDRHARNLAYGYPTGKSSPGKREFYAISDMYAEAADYAGIHINQMQAITWVAWRRIIGIK